MISPPVPSNEFERLLVLHALRILDTHPEERFDRLTRLARRLFGVPIALVSLVDSNRQWFKSRIGLNATETPRDVSFCGHAINANDVFLIEDAQQDPRFQDNPLVTGPPNIRFYAGCPVKLGGDLRIGTLCLIDSRPRRFDADDKASLIDLAAIVEHEIAAVSLATTDELTGIFNRRGFEASANQVLNLCQRVEKPASLLLFDLDGFKAINDRFGHQQGDQALKAFAGILCSLFRGSDVVGRLGGDEFAVVLANTPGEAASAAIQRFADSLHEFNRNSTHAYTLACSGGAASLLPGTTRTLQDLMAEADCNMYEHKRDRRRMP